eukprot:TRINITY_DN9169_c0_g1_i1.p2 TRINITY_DN9169_c0_g1~~TRINITY_DN9169_c0_g1_i1.p2  ORF type:complete len:186 (+),score=9.95 TRINITY_DN9169_c0_g1_i1:508-1065(+)
MGAFTDPCLDLTGFAGAMALSALWDLPLSFLSFFATSFSFVFVLAGAPYFSSNHRVDASSRAGLVSFREDVRSFGGSDTFSRFRALVSKSTTPRNSVLAGGSREPLSDLVGAAEAVRREGAAATKGRAVPCHATVRRADAGGTVLRLAGQRSQIHLLASVAVRVGAAARSVSGRPVRVGVEAAGG